MFEQLGHHLGFESESKYSYSMSNNLRGYLQVWSRENASLKQQTNPAQRSDSRDVLSSGLYFNLQRDTEQWIEDHENWNLDYGAKACFLVSKNSLSAWDDAERENRVWVSGRERERFGENTQHAHNKTVLYSEDRSLIQSKCNIFFITKCIK